MRWRIVGRATVLVAALLAASMAGLPPADPLLDRASAQEVHAATGPAASLVSVTAAGTRRGEAFEATGTGVVLDVTGLVLIGASVVAPDAPGVAATYRDPGLPGQVEDISVAIPAAEGRPLERDAEVVVVDGYLDLAIIDIGPDSGLPALPLATTLPAEGAPVDLATLNAGRTIKPVAASGEVAGLADDPRLVGKPAWVTTDIETPEPDPGGAMTDAGGALVAYPTWQPGWPPQTVYGRSAPLIAPLLLAARAGTGYTSRYVVPGTGREAMEAISWATAEDPCNVAQDERGEVTDYPTGPSRITAEFSWDGFTDGEDYLEIWYDADPDATDPVLVVSPSQWGNGPSGDCYGTSIYYEDGTPIPDGAYGVQVHAGGQLRPLAQATTSVGRAQEGVNLTGRIVDADTGKGIKEALVFILVKGTDLQAWLDDPTDRGIAATGTTDKRGNYETAPPIAPDVYPFLVFAEGYQTIGGTLDVSQYSNVEDLQMAKAG